MSLKSDPLSSVGHIRESVESHTREGAALDWIIVNQNSVACGRPRVQTFLKFIHRNDRTLGGGRRKERGEVRRKNLSTCRNRMEENDAR